MLLALDYDHTYLADPSLWDAVIKYGAARGHSMIFTTRQTNESDEEPAITHPHAAGVVYTSGKSKHSAAYAAGFCPGVWIDSAPRSIIADDTRPALSTPAPKAQLFALDYDDTYTRDPAFWDHVIVLAHAAGHTVVCATMRYPHETDPVHKHLGGKVARILPTGRKAKLPALAALGLTPDVWLDDQPVFLFQDAYDPNAELNEQRWPPARP